MGRAWGRPLRAALLPPALVLAAATAALAADVLEVTGEGGAVLARLPLDAGADWCLRWNHSVTGGAVADCFARDGGRMVLRRSYLHDFAAGLGHIPGRGTQRPDPSGGYWIEDINESLPPEGLLLRVGPARVDHRIETPAGTLGLSALAPGKRVRLRLNMKD